MNPARTGAALFLPCAGGTEALLVDECHRLLGADAAVEPGRGGVTVHGDESAAMRLNLGSRLAQRVLWPLAAGDYRDEDDLYALARRVRWADWIGPQHTLRVDTSARAAPLRSLHFAALRIKDAVCDALREATGARPGVDTRAPDLPLLLHLGERQATLYVDTSGEALFKRGWRDAGAAGQEVKGEAPLKETLAAAMLAAAGWHGRADDPPLFDPCCGAGTIAIEAAQLACGIAPGLQRHFAFERLAPFRAHAAAWQAMRRAARERVHAPAVAVHAGDVSFRMTDFAARNARRAGVGEAIAFKAADALQRPAPADAGVLMLNPPYGERIAPKGRGSAREGFERAASAGEFFAALAAHWKRHYAGWTAWVLSPELQLPGLMRLKATRRVPMWNGPIECRLFRFDMVAGSARPRARPDAG
ncbi:THUMP domain-containing protein [Azohydromonas sp.]|uniref:THUMP domain-containing class I SAM-dependent RNA methyltransferase n=1 Tax=Azohydromonas sp. TaxID=1872666 RepID=UPI002CBDC1F7|nr:THUMP domain-containing protein [Azohydromonas sp.]HMM84954.1 THUMP domain-containing protein [Azohydromonas sp.]